MSILSIEQKEEYQRAITLYSISYGVMSTDIRCFKCFKRFAKTSDSELHTCMGSKNNTELGASNLKSSGSAQVEVKRTKECQNLSDLTNMQIKQFDIEATAANTETSAEPKEVHESGKYEFWQQGNRNIDDLVRKSMVDENMKANLYPTQSTQNYSDILYSRTPPLKKYKRKKRRR